MSNPNTVVQRNQNLRAFKVLIYLDIQSISEWILLLTDSTFPARIW